MPLLPLTPNTLRGCLDTAQMPSVSSLPCPTPTACDRSTLHSTCPAVLRLLTPLCNLLPNAPPGQLLHSLRSTYPGVLSGHCSHPHASLPLMQAGRPGRKRRSASPSGSARRVMQLQAAGHRQRPLHMYRPGACQVDCRGASKGGGLPERHPAWFCCCCRCRQLVQWAPRYIHSLCVWVLVAVCACLRRGCGACVCLCLCLCLSVRFCVCVFVCLCLGCACGMCRCG